MHLLSFSRATYCLLSLFGCVFLASHTNIANAQTSTVEQKSPWQYRASIYGYFPRTDGTINTANSPLNSGTSNISIDTKTILDNLDFTFMGNFEAHNGEWGIFTDLLYLNLAGNKSASRDFSIGGNAPPAALNADFNLGLKGLVWTLAGERRLLSDSTWQLDLLVGTRLFDVKQKLDWTLVGELGGVPEASRSGNVSANKKVWDLVIGLKGNYTYGPGSKWSTPFYLDIGSGQSQLTWQAAAGISYAYQWGELSALWRYLSYDFKSGSALQNINFNGPMLGATFKW